MFGSGNVPTAIHLSIVLSEIASATRTCRREIGNPLDKMSATSRRVGGGRRLRGLVFALLSSPPVSLASARADLVEVLVI
ncbi:MAG: hypothetical protein IH985_02135 [Planctomycetes bacterium]|nr:hypothetical protein [Planctomycetota bacterium]